jgi:16S rRNA (guanine527-N7)-methyltransferase
LENRDINWFKSVCDVNGFIIKDDALNLLDKFTHLLISQNQQVNLISKTSEVSIWEEHILHCISFLFLRKIKEDSKILDLGTGGGLPGIPLKILYPGLDLTLLDSTGKKIAAVNDMIHDLGLKNIRGISARAEEISSKSEYSQKFDYIICRAVSSLKNIVNWSWRFLNPEVSPQNDEYVTRNSILILKGGNLDEEIKHIGSNKNIKSIENIELNYSGSETLTNPDKKLIILKMK